MQMGLQSLFMKDSSKKQRPRGFRMGISLDDKVKRIWSRRYQKLWMHCWTPAIISPDTHVGCIDVHKYFAIRLVEVVFVLCIFQILQAVET